MVKLVFQVIDALVVECRDREGGDGCEVLEYVLRGGVWFVFVAGWQEGRFCLEPAGWLCRWCIWR